MSAQVISLFPGAAARPALEWPAASNIAEGFSVALAAAIYWLSAPTSIEMPTVIVGMSQMPILDVFEAAANLDGTMPLHDRAMFVCIALMTPGLPVYTTYREGAQVCTRSVMTGLGYRSTNGGGG